MADILTLTSGAIKLFPFGTDRSGTGDEYCQTLSEKNITQLLCHSVDKDSFVISNSSVGNTSSLKFVIHGYYFEATFTGSIPAYAGILVAGDILSGSDSENKFNGIKFSDNYEELEDELTSESSGDYKVYILSLNETHKYDINRIFYTESGITKNFYEHYTDSYTEVKNALQSVAWQNLD